MADRMVANFGLCFGTIFKVSLPITLSKVSLVKAGVLVLVVESVLIPIALLPPGQQRLLLIKTQRLKYAANLSLS
jgi:hypothetical protein